MCFFINLKYTKHLFTELKLLLCYVKRVNIIIFNLLNLNTNLIHLDSRQKWLIGLVFVLIIISAKRVYGSRRNQCGRRCCNLAAQTTTTSTFASMMNTALICSEVNEVIFYLIVLLYLKKQTLPKDKVYLKFWL